MKKYKLLLLIGLIMALVSCGEDEVQDLSFTADAFIRGMYVKEKVSYAPVLLAVVNQKVENVPVVDSKKNKYILVKYWNYQDSLRWVPEATNFTTEIPATETYTFTLKDKADKIKEQDKTVNLTDVPDPFEIKGVTYDKEKKSLKITWSNANATTYLVQITTELDEYPLFQSASLEITEADAELLGTEITEKTFHWLNRDKFDALKQTQKYIITIHAFNVASRDDILGEFVATKTITWGKLDSPKEKE